MKIVLVRTPIFSQFHEDFIHYQGTVELQPFIGEVFIVEERDISHYIHLCSDVFVRHPCTFVEYLLDLSCFMPVDDEAEAVFQSPHYKQGYIGV